MGEVKVVGVIPARAGSKGVKDKNMRMVGGYPLVRHAIVQALLSKSIDMVVVTTDCPRVKGIALLQGAFVVDRPPELAADDSPTVLAVEHALRHLDLTPEVVVLLQPTSPLRRHHHIDEAMALFDKGAESVVSMVTVEDDHPGRMYIQDRHGVLVSLFPHLELRRRQDLPMCYRRNGAIYAIRYQDMVSLMSMIGPSPTPYIMGQHDSVNIDTEFDLVIADTIMRMPNENTSA